MEKNVATKWIVFAFGAPDHGTLAGKPVTGDAANITANLYLDGSATPNAVDDVNPTELGGGYYVFDITSAEANADNIVIVPASSTAEVNVIGVPGAVYTTPVNFNAFNIAANGDIGGDVDGSVVGSVGSVTGSVGSVTGAVQSVTNAVTVGTINANVITGASIAASALNDKGNWNVGKTGYSLTQAFPANFANLSISVTTGLVDITQTAADKVWASATREITALPAITTNWLTATGIAAGALNGKGDWNIGKTGYSLTQSFPTNFDSLSIAGTGEVTISAASVSAIWDEVLTTGTHNVVDSAGRRLRAIEESGGYMLGCTWVDEIGGASTGTVDYEDGTVTNRSNDFDNAKAIADSVGINGIQVSNGNSITLTGALEGYNVWGNGSTLAFGTQNLGGSIFRQFGQITGTATSTANPIFLEDCLLGAVTMAPAVLQRCGIGLSSGTFTIGSAGDFLFIDCYSRVAGSGAPVIDLGVAIGATTVEFRRWSGGLTLNNVQAGDVVSIDCVSGGTITVNGTGGSVSIRGMVTVVDGSAGSVTINQIQVVNQNTINTEVDTALTDYDALVPADLPTNFSLLSIDGSGLVDVTQAAADKVWATAARTLTAATNITSDASAINVTSGVVDTVTDLTVLSTTTRGEPGQGIPPETAAPLLKLDYMFKFQTNKLVQTGTQNEYYNRAGTVVDHKESTAEAVGVITVGNKVSGP